MPACVSRLEDVRFHELPSTLQDKFPSFVTDNVRARPDTSYTDMASLLEDAFTQYSDYDAFARGGVKTLEEHMGRMGTLVRDLAAMGLVFTDADLSEMETSVAVYPDTNLREKYPHHACVNMVIMAAEAAAAYEAGRRSCAANGSGNAMRDIVLARMQQSPERPQEVILEVARTVVSDLRARYPRRPWTSVTWRRFFKEEGEDDMMHASFWWITSHLDSTVCGLMRLLMAHPCMDVPQCRTAWFVDSVIAAALAAVLRIEPAVATCMCEAMLPLLHIEPYAASTVDDVLPALLAADLHCVDFIAKDVLGFEASWPGSDNAMGLVKNRAALAAVTMVLGTDTSSPANTAAIAANRASLAMALREAEDASASEDEDDANDDAAEDIDDGEDGEDDGGHATAIFHL